MDREADSGAPALSKESDLGMCELLAGRQSLGGDRHSVCQEPRVLCGDRLLSVPYYSHPTSSRVSGGRWHLAVLWSMGGICHVRAAL